MDREANCRMQVETAAEIVAIWNKADPDSGDLTPDQYYEIAVLANSLAGLVQGLAEWNAKQR